MTKGKLKRVLAMALMAVGAIRAEAASEPTRYHTTEVEGLKIFYREAGDPSKPTVLLLHGFPTSSHMFRNLIPALSDRYHVVAPDYPGFGNSSAPSAEFCEQSASLPGSLSLRTAVLRLTSFSLRRRIRSSDRSITQSRSLPASLGLSAR